MGFFYFIGTVGADEFFDAVSTIRLDLLELIGKGYVVEHCISFFRRKTERERWQIYVAEGIKLLTENTAKQVGGMHLVKSYADNVTKKKEPKKTGADIVREVITRAGLKVKQ